jgi:predicted RNase H-like HicB family nuclease
MTPPSAATSVPTAYHAFAGAKDRGDGRHRRDRAGYLDDTTPRSDVEFVFEPEDEGGYHAYAPELPGLHTQGESLEDATANAEEALALYVEGMREEGRSLEMGVVRRRLPLPA